MLHKLSFMTLGEISVISKREVITRVFSMLTGAFPEVSDRNLIMVKLRRLLN